MDIKIYNLDTKQSKTDIIISDSDSYICSILAKMKQKAKAYNRIKAVLAEKQLQNKDLATKVGVTLVTVNRWTSNSRQPGLEMLFKIAKSLKVRVADLINENQD